MFYIIDAVIVKDMFDVHCHVCDRQYLVGTGSIASFHNTSEGRIAYVRCPQGHRLMRRFARRDARTEFGASFREAG